MTALGPPSRRRKRVTKWVSGARSAPRFTLRTVLTGDKFHGLFWHLSGDLESSTLRNILRGIRSFKVHQCASIFFKIKWVKWWVTVYPFGDMAANLLTVLDIRNARPGYDPTLGRRKAEASNRPGFNPDEWKQPDPAIPFKMRDGRGLFLEVRPSGMKVWRYRYRLSPGEPDQMFTIGEAGDAVDKVSLAKAREARDEARKLVKQGTHPKQHREIVKANVVREGKNTFRALAEEWLEEAAPHWTEEYAKQVRRGLEVDVYPELGSRPVRDITSSDVLAILKTRRHQAATASNLRLWIGSVFRYGIAHGAAWIDPTYALRGVIKQPPAKHHKPLPVLEIPAFIKSVRAHKGRRQVAIAAELLMLTFVRPGEMCGARWKEFDMGQRLWLIPAERMKMREDHYVPLSDAALELLIELRELTGKREHLFPNLRDPKRPMEQGTLNLLFENAGYAGRFSPHGCRATASTVLNEMGFRPDLVERQLAHAERNKSRAAYNQAQFLAERREMMAAWADRVLSAPADNVVPIRATA